MECWNMGLMAYWETKEKRSYGRLTSSKSSFHDSTIPLLQEAEITQLTRGGK
jgi:hypothetical protein